MNKPKRCSGFGDFDSIFKVTGGPRLLILCIGMALSLSMISLELGKEFHPSCMDIL